MHFCLLSLSRGKFGQRCKLTTTEYYTEPEPYFNTVFDAANEISEIRIVSSSMVAVSYQKVLPYN